MMRRALLAGCAACLLGAPAAGAGAQSVLERTPNLTAGWVGEPGTLYFNFLHRFTSSGEPERKVTAVPTFLLAAGLPAGTLLGLHYSTNSAVAPRYPNEWEAFARWRPWREAAGAWATLALQAGWNAAARSADAEISLARSLGPLRVIGAGRFFSNAYDVEQRTAIAGGATLHLGRWLALAGDVGALTERDPGENVAWGAGLQIAIPYTPHTLSLQATNASTGTLEGLSRGADETRYGFEFTIPLTLARYFPGLRGATATPVAARGDATPGAPAAGEVTVHIKGLQFGPDTIRVAAGTTVVWQNDDPLAHSSTADSTVTGANAWDSGLIEAGASWRRTYSAPGTYPYHCTPHPFMRGVVVVTER